MTKNLLTSLFLAFLIIVGLDAYGQNPRIITSGTTFSTPAGTKAMKVEAWGGGGSGGNNAGGGGGGGAYSRSNIPGPFAPSYPYAIGAAGNNSNGGLTTFGSGPILVSSGGGFAGVDNGNGGNGGTATVGNETTLPGGNGSNPSGNSGGSGGNSPGGGIGGTGGNNGSPGSIGTNPGGGGGGSGNGNTTRPQGGLGQIRISYIALTSANGTDNQSVCAGGSVVNIQYSVPINSTVGITSLPSGLSQNYSSGTGLITISGVPTSSGTYTINVTTPYSVTLNTTGSVTVNPVPAINNLTNTVCSGNAFSLTPANGTNGVVPTGTTYSWAAPSLPAGVTGGAAGSGANAISGTLTNSTNTAQTVTYTVNPTSGSCSGTPFTVTVTVSPRPAVNNLTATICSGDSFSLTPANGTNGVVPTGTTYSWAAPSLPAGVTGGAAGSGANAISGTLTNSTNTAQTVTYTVTPTSGSCSGTPFTVTVTVSPRPAVNNLTATICSGDSFSLTPANGTNGVVPTGTTYSWAAPSLPAGVTGGAAGSGANAISGTLTNSTNTAQTVTYTVTPTSGSCSGTPFTVTVTVSPRPAVNNLTATICSGDSFSLTPANGTNGVVPTGTTYSWAAPSLPAGVTGGAAGSGANAISGTLTNSTNTAQTVTYTVTPTSGSCSGTPFTVTVTVSPRPAVNNLTATICSGDSFSLTPANGTNGVVPTGTTYSWAAPSLPAGVTGGAAGSGANAISGTLTNSTNTAQTVTYTVTPTSGSCSGTPFTVTVTVSPRPAVNNLTATICSGDSFSLTPANGTNGVVPTGTTYSWAAPSLPAGVTGGAAGSGANAISGTLTNSTNTAQTVTYTVTPTSGSCSGTPFTVTVTVSPRPNINDYNISICTGSSFSITPSNGTNGIVPAGTTYSWSAPSVTGGISGGAAGGGSSNISGTLVNPTDSPQTATYTITAISGICSSSTFTVVVTVDPITDITSHPSTALDIECFGDGFEPLTVTAVGGGLTYQWYRNTVASNVGGTAVTGANSPSFTPPSTTQGSAWYYVIVTGNCGTETSDVSGQHLVTPPVTTISQHPNTTNQSTCLGGSFPTPTLTVQALGEGTITYQWYRNTTNSNTGGTLIPGATSSSYTPPTDNVGTTYYYATGKSNCGTVPTNASGAFTVTPPTAINTENLGAQTICFGSSFTPISVTATGTGTLNYQWYSNTSANNTTGTPISGATNSSYTPPSSSAGIRYYYVVVSSSCGTDQTSSISGAMTVNALPTPTFISPPTGPVCVGASVTYQTQSGQSNYIWSGFGTAGTDYNITAGGIGSTNHTVTVTWLTSGTKNISVRYTDTNNCAATVSATNSLVVNSLPTPTFTTAPTGPVCVGIPVTYTTQSGGGQSNYAWSIPGVAGTDYNITAGGIGSTNSTVTLTWLTSGSKTVTVGYTNLNNCTATTPASNTLTVNALPVPTFTTSPSSLICLQQDVTYTTQTGKSNYVWSLPGTAGTDYTIVSGGTGSSSSSVTVRWLTTGSKTVTARYREPSTGCTATANASSTTTVEPFATVGQTSVAFPTVCKTSPTITPFTQATTGVTAIGTPTGLPAGVIVNFNPSTGNIEFSGEVSTAAAGLYNYSIPLNGNCINGLTATGTIHVVPTYEITAISSVSATSIGGNATVFFYGSSSTMINGTYEVSYEIKQGSGSFTTHPATATVNNGRGVFSTIPINSNTDTYTVRILSIKRNTDLCTTTFTTDLPTTYFGVCSAVYGANSTFTVPANVYSITIEVYGGGGGGSSNGGGGGGAYSIRQNIPVTPGEPLAVFVGSGGNNNGGNGRESYVTRDSNIGNQLANSLVYANGGSGATTGNAQGGTFDPRYSGSNGNNSAGNNGGKAGGPLGGAAGSEGVNGSSPGGGGGRRQGTRGTGGNGLVVISYSCPDADNTDCVKVIDDGAKSGTTVLEFECDYTWTAPEGLAGFTVYVGSAGGGGGSGEGSGGGGSGALIRQTFTTSNPYGLPPNTSFIIGVGEGGPGAPTVDSNGFPGEASTFSGSIDGSSIYISVPGGGGGASRANNLGGNGASGGGGSATPAPTKSEGPGGSRINISYSGPNSVVYLGNPGGNGDYSDPQNSVAGGGGGGLTPWKPAPADDGQHGKAAGNGQGEGGRGGDGIVLTLGDSLRYFGAGGGGIGRFFNGTDKIGEGGSAGGVRIGGSGNLSGTNPKGSPGTNKTGSGGGAGYFGGGDGGDGIVYITFLNLRILEVEYLYFEASYLESDQKGLLKWATSKEWENSHFEIERSINGVANWQKIGTVKGQGYSNESVEYQFKDENLPASGGIIYYRLKQFDFDGKFAYSKVKSIQVEPISGNSYWIAYPNPSNRNEPVSLSLLNTSVYNDEPIVIRISDAKGVTETYTVRSTEEVSEKFNYHLRDIDHGLFIIQLIWGNHQQQIKLIRK